MHFAQRGYHHSAGRGSTALALWVHVSRRRLRQLRMLPAPVRASSQSAGRHGLAAQAAAASQFCRTHSAFGLSHASDEGTFAGGEVAGCEYSTSRNFQDRRIGEMFLLGLAIGSSAIYEGHGASVEPKRFSSSHPPFHRRRGSGDVAVRTRLGHGQAGTARCELVGGSRGELMIPPNPARWALVSPYERGGGGSHEPGRSPGKRQVLAGRARWRHRHGGGIQARILGPGGGTSPRPASPAGNAPHPPHAAQVTGRSILAATQFARLQFCKIGASI